MSVGNMILSSSRLPRVSSAKAILTLQTVIHSLHTVMWWLYWLCSVFVSMVTVLYLCSVCSGHGFSCVCVGGQRCYTPREGRRSCHCTCEFNRHCQFKWSKHVCRSTVCTQYCRVLNFQHSCSITVNVHRLHVTFIVTLHGMVLTFIIC